jgi:hypothetical protein
LAAAVSGLHDRPPAVELVAAVRALLEGPLGRGLTGASAFEVRVAANALRIVERELRLGPAQSGRYAALLAGLGCANEAALAAAIRAGALDDRLAEVHAVVGEIVGLRLAVDHPGYDLPTTAGPVPRADPGAVVRADRSAGTRPG